MKAQSFRSLNLQIVIRMSEHTLTEKPLAVKISRMAKFEKHDPAEHKKRIPEDNRALLSENEEPGSPEDAASGETHAYKERKTKKRNGKAGHIALVTFLGVVLVAAILILAQQHYGLVDRVLTMDIGAAPDTSVTSTAEVSSEDASSYKKDAETFSEEAFSSGENTESRSEESFSVNNTESHAEESSASEAEGKDISSGETTASSSESSRAASESTDTTPPVIHCPVNTWIAVQTQFDVFDGVTATDDTDPSPVLTADVTHVNTSETGAVTVTYTATDASGNTATVKRNVHVANELVEFNGTKFPIYWNADGINGQPYLVAINRGCNTVTIYEQDTEGRYTHPVKAMACSVGEDTPDGYYRTQERYRWKDLFENSYGQYAIRIVDHILFHSVPYDAKDPSTLQTEEYNLLGTSASHGCVRLSAGDAKWLYDNCPNGFPAVLYADTDMPGPLGKPSVEMIDTEDARASWDPTDPDEANPWNATS